MRPDAAMAVLSTGTAMSAKPGIWKRGVLVSSERARGAQAQTHVRPADEETQAVAELRAGEAGARGARAADAEARDEAAQQRLVAGIRDDEVVVAVDAALQLLHVVVLAQLHRRNLPREQLQRRALGNAGHADCGMAGAASAHACSTGQANTHQRGRGRRRSARSCSGRCTAARPACR